ncbi:hypothetical protein QNA23_10555 [Rhodococcus erythropolis]|uniref:hypothetical protein n=1 Tax=Rhodococcus erythropolis TaxID=1833 RepID=UPI0024BA8F3D|nr:hypothetical protein [Rhodococcus erythropolis]MDJ0403922.1 hypothetical protein [Rhodococcus erythropolis]
MVVKRKPLEPFTIPASEVCPALIGNIVQFAWDFDSKVSAVVTGELRQISADGNDIHLNLTGAEESTGDLSEFSLAYGAPVTVNPAVVK